MAPLRHAPSSMHAAHETRAGPFELALDDFVGRCASASSAGAPPPERRVLAAVRGRPLRRALASASAGALLASDFSGRAGGRARRSLKRAGRRLRVARRDGVAARAALRRVAAARPREARAGAPRRADRQALRLGRRAARRSLAAAACGDRRCRWGRCRAGNCGRRAACGSASAASTRPRLLAAAAAGGVGGFHSEAWTLSLEIAPGCRGGTTRRHMSALSERSCVVCHFAVADPFQR